MIISTKYIPHEILLWLTKTETNNPLTPAKHEFQLPPLPHPKEPSAQSTLLNIESHHELNALFTKSTLFVLEVGVLHTNRVFIVMCIP